MTQLVFVHGVATRSGPDLDRSEATISALFARTVFSGHAFKMHAPRWGDFVPRVQAEVYETDDVAETFSISGVVDEPGLGGAEASAGSAGQVKPAATLDAVFEAFVEAVEEEDRDLTSEELDMFAKAVDALESDAAAGALIGSAASDDELAEILSAEGESYSIFSPIGKAIDAVTGRVRQAASGLLYSLVRDSVRPAIGLFSGDVFAYLHDSRLRTSIQKVVGDALREAHANKTAGEPLIVVGHSMGGVILTDMLSDLAASGLPSDLKVDCLFTVGSQPGLFQSVGALTGTPATAGGKSPKPACVAAWVNVFDPLDPLAFRAAPVFHNVVDVKFDSATGVTSAHTTYFKRPQFYARMRRRLSGLGL